MCKIAPFLYRAKNNVTKNNTRFFIKNDAKLKREPCQIFYTRPILTCDGSIMCS